MKRTKQPMEKTVINLSLGLNRPDAAEAVALGLPPGSEVRTLQAKIQELMEQGATVVAAAGNDSFDKAVADPAEIPAQDKGVIAVRTDHRSLICAPFGLRKKIIGGKFLVEFSSPATAGRVGTRPAAGEK